MNKRQKGKRVELLAKKKLIAANWLVDQKNYSRWRSEDLFSMFDIVAIKGNKVRWIQVKTNKNHFYTARKKIKTWLKENNLRIYAELWLKEPYKDWIIYSFPP